MMHPFLVFLLIVIGALSYPDDGHAQGAGGKPPPPPVLRIRPVMVPVIQAGNVKRYVTVEVTLELADPQALPVAQSKLPRLQDIMLRLFYDALRIGWIEDGDIVNMAALRRRIDEESERLLGHDAVTQVAVLPLARQSAWP